MAIRTPVKRTARHGDGAEIDSKVALRVLAAVQRGDFSARMPTDWSGSAGKVAAALNSIIESNERLEREIRRLSRNIGREGEVKRGPFGRGSGSGGAAPGRRERPRGKPGGPENQDAPGLHAGADGEPSQNPAL